MARYQIGLSGVNSTPNQKQVVSIDFSSKIGPDGGVKREIAKQKFQNLWCIFKHYFGARKHFDSEIWSKKVENFVLSIWHVPRVDFAERNVFAVERAFFVLFWPRYRCFGFLIFFAYDKMSDIWLFWNRFGLHLSCTDSIALIFQAHRISRIFLI